MSVKRSMYATLTMVCLAILSAPGLQAPVPDPNITAEERAHVVQLLQDSQKEFLSYLENVNDAQWNWKPAPDRWSVGQTAEHILLSERALFQNVEKAVGAPPNPNWGRATAGKTELIERVMPDRSHKAVAPESLQPQQTLSKAEVIRQFNESRAKTIQFAQTTQVPLKEHTWEHPFQFFGTLNAYQWLIYVPLHNLRHDQQIAEVKAAPGYPK